MTRTDSPAGAVLAEPTRRDWLGLATLATGLGMIVLDGTIVGVALPDMARELRLDITDAQWVGSLYAVVLAGLLLLAGRLADRWGRKRMFLGGIVVFLAGSALAAAAGAAAPLIAARAVQALGAAAILPSTLSIVNATFRGRSRAAAFGVWGAVISGAAAVGPLAGGALTQYASWPWIFLVNLPLGVVILVAAAFTVRESRGAGRGEGLDVVGVLLSAGGFGVCVYAVIEGTSLGPWMVALLVAGLGIVGMFVWWERARARRGAAVLLDIGLFRLRTFSWGNVTAGTVAVGEFAIVFVLPLCLVNALGMSVMGAGLVLAAMALGAFLSGASARHLAARLGPTGVVVLGLGLEVAGVIVLTLLLRPDAPGWLVALPLVVYGLGLGLASAQLTGTVLRDVPRAESGQGSATQSTVRQLGSALGTALSGAALSLALAFTLPPALRGLPGVDAASLVDSTRSSTGTDIAVLRATGGSADLVSALSSGFTDATRVALAVAAAFLVVGLAGALRLRRVAAR